MALRRRHLVYIDVGPEWKRVVSALEAQHRGAEGEFGDALREAARPVVEKVRRQALDLPAHGIKHTGLRARLAAGVRVEPSRSSVRIVATAGPGEESLPRGMDSGPRGWRHPVYGNREVWVRQRGYSWFRDTIADEQDSIERRLGRTLEEMANAVANAGRL